MLPVCKNVHLARPSCNPLQPAWPAGKRVPAEPSPGHCPANLHPAQQRHLALHLCLRRLWHWREPGWTRRAAAFRQQCGRGTGPLTPGRVWGARCQGHGIAFPHAMVMHALDASSGCMSRGPRLRCIWLLRYCCTDDCGGHSKRLRDAAKVHMPARAQTGLPCLAMYSLISSGLMPSNGSAALAPAVALLTYS